MDSFWFAGGSRYRSRYLARGLHDPKPIHPLIYTWELSDMAVEILNVDFWKADKLLGTCELPSVREKIARLIAIERERCAQVAENLNGWGHPPAPELARHIAEIIRNGH